MSLLATLTVKPLLYVAGAQLLVIIGLMVALRLAHARVDIAQAQTEVAAAHQSRAERERDAWKQDAQSATAANSEWKSVVELLKAELRRAQLDMRLMDEASRKAVATARAEADDADRALKRFTGQFQVESRKPSCARALASLEASCPALSGY
ncbi:MAG TPA: hypothetical protein VEY92_02350 [Pseudoxanthomonas sp.]|nr:hypothetical protein [Pseudoxanthomonas sp.]